MSFNLFLEATIVLFVLLLLILFVLARTGRNKLVAFTAIQLAFGVLLLDRFPGIGIIFLAGQALTTYTRIFLLHESGSWGLVRVPRSVKTIRHVFSFFLGISIAVALIPLFDFQLGIPMLITSLNQGFLPENLSRFSEVLAEDFLFPYSLVLFGFIGLLGLMVGLELKGTVSE